MDIFLTTCVVIIRLSHLCGQHENLRYMCRQHVLVTCGQHVLVTCVEHVLVTCVVNMF